MDKYSELIKQEARYQRLKNQAASAFDIDRVLYLDTKLKAIRAMIKANQSRFLRART